MVCPKCNKTVSSEDYNCIYCGTRLKSCPTGDKRSVFGKKKDKEKSGKTKTKSGGRSSKKALPVKDAVILSTDEPTRAEKNIGNIGNIGNRMRLVAICVLATIVIILIIMLVRSLSVRKGERYAEIASDYIGRSVAELNQKGELFYADNSDYYGVNTAVKFDSITESDKSVVVQGVKYPAWAVCLKLSSAKFITDVTYTDFSQLKKDIRGTKSDALIDLERFHDGDKQSAVLKEIDIRPYSINFSQSGLTTYTYKYYYKRDNNDEQAVILRVVFTEKGVYKYSSTELLIPADM